MTALNDRLYTIDVDNLGPSTARDVTIRDTLFPPLFQGVTPLSIQSCAFSVSQGEWKAP